MKTVGVIGAGGAGLCALRHILDEKDMKPIVWEQAQELGGTWLYSSDIGSDKNGLPIHSSMYTNLRTNLPKNIMGFPDFHFPSEGEPFCHHSEVLKYMQDYANKFTLLPHIKFGHHVENVCRDGETWRVTVCDLSSQARSTTVCDALIVGNGHYSTPHIPQIKGLDKFKGLISHSHDYRLPCAYKGKTVVVLGAACSGMDISKEIATVAKEVYLSHNREDIPKCGLPGNVHQVQGVEEYKDEGFVCGKDSIVQADAFLFCTGYKYNFPFFDPSCGISVEDNQVKPLYKQIIHSKYPTMGFIGVPHDSLPFPMFHFQVLYFIATLKGQVKLPTEEEMLNVTQEEIKTKEAAGIPLKHYHNIRIDLFSYMEWLARECKEEPLPPCYKKVWDKAECWKGQRELNGTCCGDN